MGLFCGILYVNVYALLDVHRTRSKISDAENTRGKQSPTDVGNRGLFSKRMMLSNGGGVRYLSALSYSRESSP
jgi:hypothetical protein